jgi:hypothetical protein
MLEQRASSRERAFMLARISTGQAPEHWCTITDISRAGAKLHFVGAAPDLPSQFAVEIAATREAYRAHVIWRNGAEIGVTFHATA